MSFDTAFGPDEQDMDTIMHLHRRSISEEQMRKFEADMATIFEAFGLDLHTPATERTPQRFLRALFDATEGYEGDPKLLMVFETECHGGSDCRLSQIIEGPIHFFSLCEHHALPFYGHAYVGYIAHEHLIGISKLTRLVRLFARRFTVQERVGQQIADSLNTLLQPHGVAVYLEAHHLCTRCEASARSHHSPARRSGGVPMTRMRRCGGSSLIYVGYINEHPDSAAIALRYDSWQRSAVAS